MKLCRLYVPLYIIILTGVSCGGGSSSSTKGTDDTSSEPNGSSNMMSLDTSMMMNDSLSHPKPSDKIKETKIRSAVFGYSFFKNIEQHETRNINAYVSIINSISHVIDTLKEINADDLPERKNDTATVLTRNIFVYKALDIQVINGGDSDFIIKSFSDSRQLIDSIDGNSWAWAITPRTDKLHGSLVMNIVAEKPDGSHEPFSVINIPITIIIDKQLNRTLWQWMMDNPEKVFTIILIPLIVFFWKQITGLFKKKS